jgi:hypothetical protein
MKFKIRRYWVGGGLKKFALLQSLSLTLHKKCFNDVWEKGLKKEN